MPAAACAPRHRSTPTTTCPTCASGSTGCESPGASAERPPRRPAAGSTSPCVTRLTPACRSEGTSSMAEHITVCICTYKRARLLTRLLEGLRDQETGGRFTYSVVVADNDHLQSARELVAEFAATSSRPITYCVEPRQNIALARNEALAHASGDFVAFIDDDEFPSPRWLLTLFEACHEYGVGGGVRGRAAGPLATHVHVAASAAARQGLSARSELRIPGYRQVPRRRPRLRRAAAVRAGARAP